MSDKEIWGNAYIHPRTLSKVKPTSRRRCVCCNRRTTHIGLANGVALMSGCELRTRRWVRDGGVPR
jgi:hypothetical protein